jgi:hypothetical protein
VGTGLEIITGSMPSQIHMFLRLINHQKLTWLPVLGMAAMRELPPNTSRKHGKTICNGAWAGELYYLMPYFVRIHNQGSEKYCECRMTCMEWKATCGKKVMKTVMSL